MNFAEELRVVEQQALPDEAGAELSGGQREHHRIGEDLAEDVGEIDRRVVAAGGVPGVEIGVPRLPGCIADHQPVDQRHDQQRPGGREEDDVVGKVGQQEAAHRQRERVADRDHDPEHAAEESALAHVKPGRVHLDHAERAEALEVAVARVEQAHGEDQPRLPAGEEHGADRQVDRRRPHRADEDGALAAEAVGKGSVEHHRERVGPEPGGGNHAHFGLVEVEHLRETALEDVEVVPPHVEGRVGEAERKPVEGAPPAVGIGMLRYPACGRGQLDGSGHGAAAAYGRRPAQQTTGPQ